MSLYDIDRIMAEYEGKTVAIIGNGPSYVKSIEKTAGNFIGVPGSESKEVKVGIVDTSKFVYPIWSINGGWYYHPNTALGWEMDDLKSECQKEHPMFDWYMGIHKGEEGCPIITSVEYPEFPRAVAFPLQRCLDELKMAYFTETIQYMIAFAIMCKVEKLHMYGCDYWIEDKGKLPAQKACTEFWLGVAHARGITIMISPESDLMKAPDIPPFIKGLYGYEKYKLPLRGTIIYEEADGSF